jgi:hypothetical protein
MGIIVGLLVSSNALFARQDGMAALPLPAERDSIPLWVEMAAYTAIGWARRWAGGGS